MKIEKKKKERNQERNARSFNGSKNREQQESSSYLKMKPSWDLK